MNQLQRLTLKQVEESGGYEVAVLPWGSCEPHNLHLPYGTDTLTVERVASIAAEKAAAMGAKVIVLPTIPVGTNSNMFGFPLTMHMSPSTQLAILKDVLRSLESSGIRKLVILNGHGGNEFKAAIRELHGQTGVFIFLLDWWRADEASVADICDDPTGEHANESETSWVMHLFPELVHLEWADDGAVNPSRLKAMNERWAWTPRTWHLLTAHSGHGNPKKATAEKGRLMIDRMTDKIAGFLNEYSSSELDETFPF